jgi:hypothetical protein
MLSSEILRWTVFLAIQPFFEVVARLPSGRPAARSAA